MEFFGALRAKKFLGSHPASAEFMDDLITKRMKELGGFFLRLDFGAFRVPAVPLSMMHDGFTKRRKWLTDQEIFDLVGAINIIPEANSIEKVEQVRNVRVGLPGWVDGGISFFLPALVIVPTLSWVCPGCGTIPQVSCQIFGSAEVGLLSSFFKLFR